MTSAKKCIERLAPPYGVKHLSTSIFYMFPVFDHFIELVMGPTFSDTYDNQRNNRNVAVTINNDTLIQNSSLSRNCLISSSQCISISTINPLNG